MAKSVKSTILKYCETTSVRGVPQALKSDDRVVRVIWIAALFVSVSMTVWQLQRVFSRYCDYQTVSTMREVKDAAVFPAVTACNTSPLGDKENAKLTWNAYLETVKYRKSLVSTVIADDAELSKYANDTWIDILSELETPSGYFANLPITVDDGGSGTTGSSNLVVDCAYYTWEWNLYTGQTPDSSFDCRAMTVHFIWDNNYFRCASFQLAPSDAANVRGLTSVFYIDDFTTSRVDAFRPSIAVSRAIGLQVSVSPAQTVADMKVGEAASPGTESTIRLTQIRRRRQAPPYGDCVEPYFIATMDPRREELYTTEKCVGLCLQQQVVDACGCVSRILPFNYSQLAAVGDPPLCGNQSLLVGGDVVGDRKAILKFARRIVCAKTAPVSSETCDCPEPCTEYTYAATGNGSPWPNKSYKLAFYDAYVANSSAIYGHKFDVYARIKAQISNASDDVIMERLAASTLIEENFLQLNVVFDSYMSLEFDDLPAMTVELLAANVGGTLSLWLGVTLMAIVEVVELVYKVVLIVVWWRRTKTAAAPVAPASPAAI